MLFRQLGDSDLEVSEISLGSWLTFAGGVSFEQTKACTDRAVELGINFFDTANQYGDGAAEEAWGQVLSAHPRDSYILATKLFFPVGGHGGGLSRSEIHKQLDDSLRRLQTDYVDLYQCHRFDVEVPIEETMEALTEVVDAGKVRCIGFSEWTPQQIRAGLFVSETEKFVSSQPRYNMLWRGPEQEIFELCASHGISQIVWSPLCEGVLTGKYVPGTGPPDDSRAAHGDMGFNIGNFMADDLLAAVQDLQPIADELGVTMAQLALAWVLSHPHVASAIVGASRPEQLEDNVGASGVQLSAELLGRIDAVLGEHVVRESRLAPVAREGVMHRADVSG